MAALAVKCAEQIKEDLEKIFPADVHYPVFVLNGIQINFEGDDVGEDYFCPLSFTLRDTEDRVCSLRLVSRRRRTNMRAARSPPAQALARFDRPSGARPILLRQVHDMLPALRELRDVDLAHDMAVLDFWRKDLDARSLSRPSRRSHAHHHPESDRNHLDVPAQLAGRLHLTGAPPSNLPMSRTAPRHQWSHHR